MAPHRLMGSFDLHKKIKVPKNEAAVPCEIRCIEGLLGKEAALASLSQLQRDTNNKKAEHWYLFVRFGSRWNGPTETRIVFLVILRPPKQLYCYIMDGYNLREARAFGGTPPVDGVLVCVADLMKNVKCRLKRLVCCPSVGRFRLSQTLSLATKLEDVFVPVGVQIAVPKCTDFPENQPGSLAGNFTTDPENNRALWTKMDGIVNSLHSKFDRIMDQPGYNGPQMATEAGGYYAVPYMLHTNPVQRRNLQEASSADLRELFESAKLFHEARVWDYLSTNEYLYCQDKVTGKSGYVRVCGHSDYDARGLVIYSAEEDLGRVMDFEHYVDKLDYFGPQVVSLGTVDAVTSLGLPLAQNDPLGAVWPSWNRHKGCSSQIMHDEEALLRELMKNANSPAPCDRWKFLSRVTRAVVSFVANPMFVSKNPAANGYLTTMVVQVSMNFGEGEMDIKAGHHRVGILSDSACVETMAIGAKHKCNFCN